MRYYFDLEYIRLLNASFENLRVIVVGSVGIKFTNPKLFR